MKSAVKNLTTPVFFLVLIASLAVGCENIFDNQLELETRILFLSRRPDFCGGLHMYVMDINGDNQTRISDYSIHCSSEPCPSNKGDRIAFITRDSGYYDLRIVDTIGLVNQFIARNVSSCMHLSWSPKDDKILYVKTAENSEYECDIFLRNLLTNKEFQLTSNGKSSCPVWFHNGQNIAYISTFEGRSKLFVMKSDGSDKRLIEQSNISFSNPKISPDGKKIAVTSRSWEGSQIFVMNSDGSRLVQLTNTVDPDPIDPIGWPIKGNEDPKWAPNSKMLVYITYENSRPDIAIIDIEERKKRILTEGDFDNHSPCWTKDGKYIIYSSRIHIEDHYEIYRITWIGSHETNLSNYLCDDFTPVVF